MPSLSGKNYDWRGLDGEELASARRRWQTLVDFFVSKLPPALTANRSVPILYVGCAYGAIQKTWIDMGYENIEGIEWAEERGRFARECGCRVTITDYRELPMFRDKQFKVAIVDRVLSHTDEINYRGPEDLAELFRVCDDQAAILIHFHRKWKPAEIKQFFDLGWSADWGVGDNGLLHLTLYRGCDLPARSSHARLRWFAFQIYMNLRAFMRSPGGRSRCSG